MKQSKVDKHQVIDLTSHKQNLIIEKIIMNIRKLQQSNTKR